MRKGLLIYRDFGAQHGFLTYLILTPFVLDKSLSMLKLFYFVVQTINLVLVLSILKKSSSKLGMIIGGFLYILLNFYVSDNNLWDEVMVTSFFLLIYCLSACVNIRLNFKLLLSGFILGLATFMKPSFAVMLFPLLIVYRSLVPLIPVGLVWTLVLLFFFLNRGLYQLLDNYIFYNKYYALLPKGFFVEKNFFYLTVMILLVAIFLFIILRKSHKNNLYLSFLFMLFSIVLFLPSYHKVHLPPFIAFFTVFIGQFVGQLKKQHLFIFLITLFFYGLFLIGKTKRQYFYLNNFRRPYMDDNVIYERRDKLKFYPLSDKKLYILGNQVELYYLLDVLPPNYFTLVFPFVITYYPTLEKRIIEDLKKNRVEYIAIPKPRDRNYSSFKILKKYVVNQYRLEKESLYVQLYKKI